MNWLVISLQWYIVLFLLGIIFVPLTKRVFGRVFFDFGYPFAKTLAIIFLSYSAFFLGIIKILPFNRLSLILILCLFTIVNYLILKRHSGNPEYSGTSRITLFLIIFEEILFLLSFLFWTYIRSQEPSVRSLEKFMDFGFINSILRSQYFPPLDIWFSADNGNLGGYPINYYYFGHLVGAVLIKLSNIKSSIGYNLLLATIFGLGVTQVFSLVVNIVNKFRPASFLKLITFGLFGAFITNLGGNLHTIYTFTSGYPNENPIPFWKILSGFNPTKYWYPNATRFIPFTIHEFPSYSYVVADLHGHVFDIPFVLLTIAILFIIFIQNRKVNHTYKRIFNFKFSILNQFLNSFQISNFKFQIIFPVFLGFLTAIHYMTNAFDGPIYILLTLTIFLILFKFSSRFIITSIVLISSFLIFSFPFSYHFKPFVTGIGVNCSPEFLIKMGGVGPFLFEKGNCQVSSFWMLFVLWGFFWICLTIFILIKIVIPNLSRYLSGQVQHDKIERFILILFSFGTFLVIVPEFFYIKDIYPAHFRANTMFKLGYQAFIMMSIASITTFFLIKKIRPPISYLLSLILSFFSFFVVIYPFFSIPSYYGNLSRKVEIDGAAWLTSFYPEDKEIIDFLNRNVQDQPVILEAQGDSYTDYERISAYTGLPTVAGWWVHEWLWRGSSDVVGKRIPDIIALYESKDAELTKLLIKKYQIRYLVVSGLERQKYPNLYEQKLLILGKEIFRSSNGIGAIYQVN